MLSGALRTHSTPPSGPCSCLALQTRVRKFGAKWLQLLAEWTETFPRDFEEESTIGHLTDVVGRISPCDEVSRTWWKSLPLPLPSHPGPAPVSSLLWALFSPHCMVQPQRAAGAQGRARTCIAEEESKALFEACVSTSPFCPGNK